MTQEREQFQQAPCFICGNPQFIWGDYQDAGFKPDGSRVLVDWQKQRARYCERCGNLQVFTDWDRQAQSSLWERFKGTS